MMLLSTEIATYAPSVKLTGAKLESAIALVESQIEAYIDRSLELQEYTQIYQLGTNFPSFYPLCRPIVNILSLKVRSNRRKDYYHHAIATSEWQTLNDYILDTDGRVSLDRTSNNFQSWGRNFPFTEAEIHYLGGLDFTQDTKEINAIKYAIGAILTYQAQNQSLSSGKVEENIVGEYQVKWGADAIGIPKHLLTIFDKYRST